MPPLISSPAARLVFWFVGFFLILSRVQAASAAVLRSLATPHYLISTDLAEPEARELALRLDHIYPAYQQLARQLNISPIEGPPVETFVYRSPADYHAAGGWAGTAGTFLPYPAAGRIFAVAGPLPTLATWHTIQHEAFHAFAHTCLPRTLPPWLGEGMADYFGEAIFTGDEFTVGLVPPWRLKRLQNEIAAGQFLPAAALVALSSSQWREQISVANYDQAWSWVHFLIQADHGKYHPLLTAALTQPAATGPVEAVFSDQLTLQWRRFWMTQPPTGTSNAYAAAIARTLTSFLARATAAGQRFDSFDQFRAAGQAGRVASSNLDWLPPSLLISALGAANSADFWQLLNSPQPALSARLADGTTLTGRFKLQSGRVVSVDVVSVSPSTRR